MLLSILDSVQIKEEPLEPDPAPVVYEDPLAVDLSPLVKVEISDNPLIITEEDVSSHAHSQPGTETLGRGIWDLGYQLKPVFPHQDHRIRPIFADAQKRKSTEKEDYDQFRKLKKTKLERERRVVLKELFEDLDYWVTLGLDERSRRWRTEEPK